MRPTGPHDALDSSRSTWTRRNGQVVLLGTQCPQCGNLAFPGRDFCDRCLTEMSSNSVEIRPIGVVYSCSRVHVAPVGFDVPYQIGYVDLSSDIRVLAQLQGGASKAKLAPGDAVIADIGQIRTEHDGTKVESYVFRIMEDESQ